MRNFLPGAVIDPTIETGSKLLQDKISNTIVKNGPKNPVCEVEIPAGFPANFATGVIAVPESEHFWPRFNEPILVEDFQVTSPVKIRSGWSSRSILENFISGQFTDLIDKKGQRTRFFITRSGAVYVEKDRSQHQSHVLSTLNGLGTVQEAATMLGRMGVSFSYPKPVRLLSYLISAVCNDRDALIMDAFSGSGTTGHAVLELNRNDEGNRKFIAIELDNDIATDKAAKRLKAVITGYSYFNKKKQINVKGAGSGFRYCTLGEPLFDADGNVSPAVTFPDLAAHVFFCETGSPIPKRAEPASALIGTFQSRAIYLLHSSEAVGVASERAGNVLTGAVLASLPLPDAGFSGQRVVYAEGCTMPEERLSALGVTFKHIPYQIEGI